MLASFVKERHDDVDSAGFTGAGKNNTLEILVVIVRAHVVFLTEHLIGAGKIGYITDDEKVMTTDRTLDNGLTFTGRETGILDGNSIVLTIESRVFADKLLFLILGSALIEVPVDFIRKLHAAFQRYKGNWSNRSHRVITILVITGISTFIRTLCQLFQNRILCF